MMTKRKTTAAGNIKRKGFATDWQVLLVNQYGRIVRIPRFQRYVILVSAVTIMAVATAVCLSFLLFRSKDANTALKKSLATTNERISTLIDEKDLLLARLMIMRNILAEENPEAAAGIFTDKAPVHQQADGEAPATVEEKPASIPWSDEMTDQDQSPAVVDIRQLSVTREPGDSLLSVRFQIHNISEPSEENVSGRIFVVLEEAPDLAEGRLVIPDVQLKDGVPARIERGDYFSIARFKPVSLTARAAHPEKLTRAVVFVFSSEGELLYKNNFEIEVPVAPAV